MSSKFEQLLDLLVNEEHEKANELFHEIVVEKSREIYDTMIAEEAKEEDEEEDESVEEASEEDEEDESVEEGFGDSEESMYEIGGEEDHLGGDAADDLVGDIEDHDAMGQEHDEEGGDEPATKDDVLDIADALEELKAEFQALLAGEKHEEEENPDVHGGALDSLDRDGDGDHDMDDHDMEDEEEADEQFMREYREVVGKPYAGGKVAGSTEEASTNKSSVVSSAKGRPSSDASANNIAQASKGEDKKAGVGGVLKAGGEFTKGVTTNLDGKTSGVKTLSKVASGHGAEKKGSGESSVNDKNTLPK